MPPATVALARLLARVPDLRLAVPGPTEVSGVELWEEGVAATPGRLVVVPGPDLPAPALLEACARAGSAGLLLRLPRTDADRRRWEQRARDRSLGLGWLTGGAPWVEVVARLLAALHRIDEDDAPDRRGADDLFRAADAVSEAVGGPVIVEDASLRVLAYSAFVGPMDRGRSEAILGRRVPDAWLRHLETTGTLARLRSGRDVADLVDGPWQARRRLLTAVRDGDRLLGLLWVSEAETPLPDGARAALRRAADDLAPALRRHLDRVDAEADRRSGRVRSVLAGGADAPGTAGDLGLGPTGALVVMAACHADAPGDEQASLQRLVDHVARCLESFRRPGGATVLGRRVVAVVGVPDVGGAETRDRLAADVLRLAGSGPASPTGLHVATSRVATGLAAVPRLKEQAVAALATLRPDPGARSVSFDQVEHRVLVETAVNHLPPGSGLAGLDRLRGHDERTGGALVASLRAFLDAAGSVPRAARVLTVHETTLRHRLRRVAEVADLRLEDPEVRLACDLALRLPTPGNGRPR